MSFIRRSQPARSVFWRTVLADELNHANGNLRHSGVPAALGVIGVLPCTSTYIVTMSSWTTFAMTAGSETTTSVLQVKCSFTAKASHR